MIRFTQSRWTARWWSTTWCTAASCSRTAELDDLIIARSDGTPTYNFCVVVDDMDMGITHVIRGDDHLNNTPRQINMLRALGAHAAAYAHVPMILGADGAKLSKRHGAVSVLEYRDEGFLPDALLNYLVRLGWSHGDQEIFTREEMIAAFDIARREQGGLGLQPGEAAVAEPAAHDARRRSTLVAAPAARSSRACGIDRGAGAARRASPSAARAREDAEGDGAEQPVLLPRRRMLDEKAAAKHLTPRRRRCCGECATASRRRATGPPRPFMRPHAVAAARRLGLGKVAQPLRVAVTGGTVSPPIDATLALLGRERVGAGLVRALRYAAGGELS